MNLTLLLCDIAILLGFAAIAPSFGSNVVQNNVTGWRHVAVKLGEGVEDLFHKGGLLVSGIRCFSNFDFNVEAGLVELR